MAASRSAKLRVAAVSMKNVAGDVEFNLDRHRMWIERALEHDPRFIGFPEFSLTGWVYERRQCLTLNSAPVREFESWARKHRVFLATCLVEQRGDRVHNTALIAGPRGRAGVMRKVNLVSSEGKHYAPGTDFPVLNVAGCRMGVTTCADATRYEMMHLLSLRGAEVLFAPHANTLGSYGNNAAGWLKWRLERWPLFARDCGVYIVGINNAGRFERSPADEPSRYCGGGACLDFRGEVIAKVPVHQGKQEGMYVADIDLVALREARRKNNMMAEFRPAIVYNRKSGWKHGRTE